MQPHSWINPHPILPQSKNGFETIDPQLEYNPTFQSRAISYFLSSRCSDDFGLMLQRSQNVREILKNFLLIPKNTTPAQIQPQVG